VLTREDVGDGEDAERPPDGAQLGLLDQILDALHPLRHLGLHARARRGAARPVEGRRGGSGGIESDAESPTPKGSAVAGEEGRAGRCRRRLVSTAIFIYGIILPFWAIFFENLYKNVPGSNQPCSAVGPTLADACIGECHVGPSRLLGCPCHVAR
jgi:hypothetical protein